MAGSGVADDGTNGCADVPVFGVVANVRRRIPHGEGGELRDGLRHFAGGAKVWVLPPQWGDGGENLFVVGRHRGRRGGYVRLVVGSRHLENFRVRAVHSPAVLRAMTAPPKPGRRYPVSALWGDRERAERFVAYRNSVHAG